MPYKDQSKASASRREWYKRNRKKAVANAMAWTAKQRVILNGMVLGIKESTPCRDCGLVGSWWVKEFDHVFGDKVKNIADLCRNGVAVETIRREIAKCDVVCANCHRTRTFVRLGKIQRPSEPVSRWAHNPERLCNSAGRNHRRDRATAAHESHKLEGVDGFDSHPCNQFIKEKRWPTSST